MLVPDGNTVDEVDVDQWPQRIEVTKADSPELRSAQTVHTFELIDVTGHAAVAKLNVYKGSTHFSTDYMLLYKFDEGWRIVSKIFAVPR